MLWFKLGEESQVIYNIRFDYLSMFYMTSAVPRAGVKGRHKYMWLNPTVSVGCNYPSLLLIPVSGTTLPIYKMRWFELSGRQAPSFTPHNICTCTENRDLSRRQLCCRWWHRKLSLWQPTVLPMTAKPASWRISVFSGMFDLLRLNIDNCS